MVRALDKADAMLTLSSREPFYHLTFLPSMHIHEDMHE